MLGAGLGAFTTAALLYLGAALIGALSLRTAAHEARVQRSDIPRLLAMAGFGAALGPVALAWGLQHTSGASASLMLTLEALFTATLAWWLYSETMDRRVWAAMLLLLAGGMALVLDQGLQGGVQLLGLLAVLLATVAWGVDNTLSRGLAERDPSQVVMAKATLGAAATAALAVSTGEPLPSLRSTGTSRRWSHWLRPESALLPPGPAGIWCGADGLGVRLRALHWCCRGLRFRGTLCGVVDALGWSVHVGGSNAPSGGKPWTRAHARSAGA